MRSGLRNVSVSLLVVLALPILLAALLWLLLPMVALPLARLAAEFGLEDRGVVISRLEVERPGWQGIRVAALHVQLSEPAVMLRAEGLSAEWRLGTDAEGAEGAEGAAGDSAAGWFDGALRSLHVARLEIEASLSASAAGREPDPAPEASFDWASVLPSAFRTRLPIEILELEAVDLLLHVGSDTLRGAGRLLLEPQRMALEAIIESDRLALPVELEANVATDDSFLLELRDPQGDAMLSARGVVEIDGARLTLTGGARFDTVPLGPALGLAMPPVVGDLNGMLQRDGDVITLRLDPGTELGAHLDLGAGADGDHAARAAAAAGTGAGIEAGTAGMRGVGLAMRTRMPFALRLDEDRLASEGTLPVSFAVTGSTQLDGHLELAELGGTLTAPSVGVRGSGTFGLAPLRGTWNLDAHGASTETGMLQLRSGARIAFPELHVDAAAAADDDESTASNEAGSNARSDTGSGAQSAAGSNPGPSALTLAGLQIMLTSDLAFDAVGPALAPSAMAVTLDALSVADQPLDVSGQRLELELAMRDETVHAGFGLAGADLSARGSARHGLQESVTRLHIDALSAALAPGALPARLAGLWLETPWPLRRGTAELEGSLRWPPETAPVALPGNASGSPAGRSPGGAGTASASLATVPVIDVRIAGSELDLAFAGADLSGATLSATLRADAAGRVSVTDMIGSAATLEYRSAPDREALRAAGVTLGGAFAVTGTGLPDAFADPADLRLDAETITVAIDRTVAFGYGLDDLRLRASASGALLDPSAALTLEADALQAGVDVSGLRCDIALEPAMLSIDSCSAAVLGGSITAPTGHWSRETGDGYVPIAVLGIDLGAALALMQDTALAGTGTLDGAVPLALVAGQPIIEDGYVGARPPGGTLRYAADAALRARLGQPGLSLVLAAMQDFRYAELGADIDYGADGELALGVRLVGASPDVEQGRRINFNLNVTQNLPTLLESLRLSQEIGEDLERRLQERFAQ